MSLMEDSDREGWAGSRDDLILILGSGSEHINYSNFKDANDDGVLLPHCELLRETRYSNLLANRGGGDNSCSSCCSRASTESPVGRGPCPDTVTETLESRFNPVVKCVDCLGCIQT